MKASENAPVELACGHAICGGCATAAAAAGHRRCPTCRAPHLLSPETLAARASGWRRRYASWRAGGVRGSHGELASIAAPPAAEEAKEHGHGGHLPSVGVLEVAAGFTPAAAVKGK